MSRIFISYARADVEFALKLALSLSEIGADIWIDVNDIPAGMKWSTAIQQGLNVCEVMLVIISPDSMASNNVEDEWQYYLDNAKPVIPLLYLPAKKHFQINRLQHIDFHSTAYHNAFDRLLHELRLKGISIQLPTADSLEARSVTSVSTQNDQRLSDQEDVLYEESVEMVRRLGKASVSLLQRRLRLGYMRSASLIDRMERDGVIGPAIEGAALRKVLPFTSIPTSTPTPISTPTTPADNTMDWSHSLDSFFHSLSLDEPLHGTHMMDDKGVEVVYVPAGKFLMGSTNEQVNAAYAQAQKDYEGANYEWYKRELPQHEMHITQGFWLDLTPVTNESYNYFIEDEGYKNPDYWTKTGWAWLKQVTNVVPKSFDNFDNPEQPRVGITWFEAFAYCRWRGGKLPTEAEWEWAARGPKSLIYPWGNEFNAERVVFKQTSGGKTAPVGSEIRLDGASWIGALDMSGNVFEWVNTQDQRYPYLINDGREDLEDDLSYRIVRAGSWWSYETPLLRTSFRYPYPPDMALYDLGFRCLRSYKT